MLRSGVSFPFPTFYRHFATLKDLLFDFPILHYHWSYSPRSSFNFLPFHHRWCYAPRSSPRYGRHGWHMVCHMVSRGTIKSYLSNLQTWKKTPFQQNWFFPGANSAMYFYQHAATRSQSQPLAATRVAASGRKWPLQPVPGEWPQVAAMPQVAASDRFLRFQFPPQSSPPARFPRDFKRLNKLLA